MPSASNSPVPSTFVASVPSSPNLARAAVVTKSFVFEARTRCVCSRQWKTSRGSGPLTSATYAPA